MKSITLLISIISTLASAASAQTKDINQCFINLEKAGNLRSDKTDKLPDDATKSRIVPTLNGDVSITTINGYRVLYNNVKKVPFVNLKVERSLKGHYEQDKKRLLENIDYFSRNEGVTSEKLNYNGYTIYGVSRTSIEEGSNLGTYVMFPGNDIVVYFYFNNLKKGYRHFETIQEYASSKNNFIGEYTNHLKNCLGK